MLNQYDAPLGFPLLTSFYEVGHTGDKRNRNLNPTWCCSEVAGVCSQATDLVDCLVPAVLTQED